MTVLLNIKPDLCKGLMKWQTWSVLELQKNWVKVDVI